MKFLSANKFIIAALALCLSACVFVFIISVKQTRKVRNTSLEVIHTNKVLSSLDKIITATLEVQNSTRGFVITGDDQFLIPFITSGQTFNEALADIRRLNDHTKVYAAKLDSLQWYISQRMELASKQINLCRQGKNSEAAAITAAGEGNRLSLTIRHICDFIKHSELDKQNSIRVKNDKAILSLNTILYTTLIIVALLGVLLFTKVKTAFNEHKAGEEKFKALLESAPDAMLISDQKGKIQLANRQAVTLLGFSNEEFSGMPVENLVPPEMRNNHRFLRDDYTKAPRLRDMQSGIDMQALKKDGSVLPVEISLSPINTNGEILVASAIRDITQRKAAQEEIQALFTQINQANEAIYVVDENIIIRTWNKGAENLYGYTREEAVGQHSVTLLRTELSKEQMETTAMQVKETGFWSGEIKRYTKQGKEIYVYSSLSEVKDKNGQAKSYVSVSFDITQRKKLEEQVAHLANIVENSSEAILSRDMEGKIISWNRGAEKMFDISKENAIGKTAQALGFMKLTAEDQQQIEHSIVEKGEWTAERQYVNNKGAVITGSVTGNAVRNSKGAITALSFVIKDITERKQLETHLRNHSAELEQQVKERTKEIALSEEKYRLLYENNPMPMWVYDIESLEILDVNNACEVMYGYSKAEFLKMTLMDVRNEEEKKRLQGFDHTFGNNKESNLNRGIWKHAKKDGTEMQVEIYNHPISFESKKARLTMLINVTERLKAEENLQSNERRFRALIEKSYDIITMLDEELRITYRSPSTFRTTGRTDEETLGTDVRQFIHPDDLHIIEKCTAKLLNTCNTVEDCVFRYRHKNGHYMWFEGKASNLLHDDNVKAIVFNYRDVTERMKSQAKIAASEKRFRALVENSYDIITMLDKDFNVLYRTPSAQRVTGRLNDDVLGLDGRKRIHPDDVPMVAKGIKRLLAAPGNVETCSFRYQHKDGHWLWFEGNATNLLHDEAVNAIVFNYREVTERVNTQKQLVSSEKRFRSLIENGADIINLLDESFRVIYRSPSAARQGCLKDEDVMGIDGRERVHPDDLPKMTEGIKRLLANPGSTEKTLFRYKFDESKYLWLEGTATNLLHDEAVNAIVFNYREVTDRLETEEKLKASEERYRSALENMMEGVQIIGFDWKYKYINEAAVKQARCKREELIGFTMMERYPGIENSSLFSVISDCFTTRKPVVLENKFEYPGGDIAWFELSIQPVQEGVFILSVDITEKVEAAAALREEKDKLLSIAVTSPGLIYSFHMTPDGIFSFPFVSNAVEDIFGFSADMLHKNVNPILESALPEDIDAVTTSIRRSAETMTHWQQQFRYRHPVKGMRWLEGNSLPTREKDGGILWHGIIMDITERKNAEERITEKNAQLETLSNNLPGVMIFQLSGEDFTKRKFTFVSKEVTRLTGKTPDEVLADPSILYNLILDEDIPRLMAAEMVSYNNFSPFNEEVRCKTSNGDIRWLNIVSTPRKTIDGKIVWDGFHVDITERKRNEEAIRSSYMEKRILADKLTTILNTLPANIALLDENGVIVDVNQSWIESAAKNGWYGSNYGIGANYISITQKSIHFAYDTATRQQLAAGIRSVLSKAADKFVYECHTTDNRYWFRKIVSPISGEDNNGALVMLIDITQIHNLEEERIKSKTEEQKLITAAILRGQEKERNAIGKELHDNINQILAGINMLMGIMVKRPERTTDLLPLCIQNINVAINENRKIAHELVSPGENAENLVEQVKNVARNMLQNAGIGVRIDYKHFDEKLLTNEQQLAAYRIVQEQCNNILKYAHAKKVVFLLHTSETRFLLIIKDNGKGADTSKHSEGIGLQNIKNRVNVFNGTVTVTSSPGNGFMLSVEIPVTATNGNQL